MLGDLHLVMVWEVWFPVFVLILIALSWLCGSTKPNPEDDLKSFFHLIFFIPWLSKLVPCFICGVCDWYELHELSELYGYILHITAPVVANNNCPEGDMPSQDIFYVFDSQWYITHLNPLKQFVFSNGAYSSLRAFYFKHDLMHSG